MKKTTRMMTTMTTAFAAMVLVGASVTPVSGQEAGSRAGELEVRLRAQAAVERGVRSREIAEIEARLRGAGAGLARAVHAARRAEARARVQMARTAGMAPRVDAMVGHVAQVAAELRGRMQRERMRAPRTGQLASTGQRAEVETHVRVPEAWLQQDPADSLYRAARAALNGGEYRRSAELFEEIRDRHPDSGYAPDSYYFQALALQRAGGTERLERALELIEAMRRRHPDAANGDDARALRLRIRSLLARRGDAPSAMEVTEQASAECESPDQELRATALSALINMDSERAVPILQEVLRSRDECSAKLRRRAIFILSQKMDDDETVDLLLDLAYRNPDPDPEVREQAVFWLSQVRSDEAMRALESILQAPDVGEELQEKALFALSQHRSDGAMEILKGYAERDDAPKNLREKAIFWIGQNPRAGGAGYLRELYRRVDDQDLKKKIVFGVAQTGDEAAGRWLLERARDPDEDPEIRKNALFWAGQTGVVGVDDLLGMYGTMPDLEVREHIIFVLSQKKGEEAVEALIDIAREEEEVRLKEKAVFWLGQSDDPRVAAFLLELIRGGGGAP